MKNKRKAILWFRQDLRLHDNEALVDALRHTDEVVPVYVFDERIFKGITKYGFPKTGKFRAKFILESILDLKQNLQKIGSDLVIRIGKPEEEVAQIASSCQSSWVFCNRERTKDEVFVQDHLEKNLWAIGQELRYSRGKMLYYTQDLPFPISHSPESFTHFRKEVEKIVRVREPLDPIDNLQFPNVNIQVGSIPELSELGHQDFESDPRSVLDFKGGETDALERLDDFFSNGGIQNYAKTKDNLTGIDYSSKLSPWLSQGCLSPKLLFQKLKKHGNKNRKNKKAVHSFFLELMWRDFYRLMGKKHEYKIFQKTGIRGNIEKELDDNLELFEKWASGNTGIPFVDANMRELNQTGYMSNRGRLNVASFLINDLNINWVIGAEYFESLLLDYDPCSNYVNWNYIAGISNDVRENPYFNILNQAHRYDPKGIYIKKWLPELEQLSSDKIHCPNSLSREELNEFGIVLGKNYPFAAVDYHIWT